MTTSPSALPRTLCEAFAITAAAQPDAIALRTPGGTVTITWREYRERVRAIASGLSGLGLRPGDTVAIMLTNRPEFHLCDTAVLHAGGTPFSVYNTNPAELLAYQFDNAETRLVICESQFLPVVLTAVAQGGKVEHIVCVDGTPNGTVGLAELENSPDPDFDFDAAWCAVRPDDVLTIVYTSGTTGPPKGVELTHTNFLENSRTMGDFGGVDSSDSTLSYLPDAHAANRWFAHYHNLLCGVQTTTVADMRDAVGALTDVRPTIFVAVPRVWVKIKAALEANVAAQPSVKRALANWALEVGRAKVRAESDGRALSLLDQVRYGIADRLVLSGIRARIGLDRLRIGVTGAAPIAPEILEFVLGLGLPICEAYGMTEATLGATINRPGRIRLGTVGTPLTGTEVTLAPDGEVLVRGANVMRGYRKQPDKTAEAIDADGWLHTGDIGEFDADGYLRIIDRKKEIIINAAGKNMSPTNIENAIIAHTPLAGPVVVIGDGRQYNTALITLDPDTVAALADKFGLTDRSPDAVAAHPEIVAAVAAGVAAANRGLSRVEQIKKYTLLAETWEPGSPHLTPTGKLRRKPIAATYAEVIEHMYTATQG
ncbi:AMP-dependent synthetase/ligase [Nocardia inohanensis]|uniref:AMP-dependent synthetase/ligase n=1 Tax=Nocardia inohanensis TaxID=209246 RepID=UPI00082FE07C|nr:long-chain fatty acid--CoA ligase [Nocardia inohanensis]